MSHIEFDVFKYSGEDPKWFKIFQVQYRNIPILVIFLQIRQVILVWSYILMLVCGANNKQQFIIL